MFLADFMPHANPEAAQTQPDDTRHPFLMEAAALVTAK
jgi:hypothetical protein